MLPFARGDVVRLRSDLSKDQRKAIRGLFSLDRVYEVVKVYDARDAGGVTTWIRLAGSREDGIPIAASHLIPASANNRRAPTAGYAAMLHSPQR